MPMQNLLLLAELKALGVCPCRIYYFWQNWGHWACAHAEFITFGRTEFNFWHWACAHADFITFGRTGGIGRVPMQTLLLLAELGALGVCPCRLYYFLGIGRVPMQNWQN